HEVSFTLNLYLDGYSIGKPSEAIESGRLSGDLLDDIPCQYVNGTLICEVRDYRKCCSDRELVIRLWLGSLLSRKCASECYLENIVKDIPLISDNSWTYGSRIPDIESPATTTLSRSLPKLDRLCDNPVPTRLNLDLSSLRRKRLRQTPEVTVTSNTRIHGKKVCIDGVPESSNSRFEDIGIISGNAMPQHVQENLSVQNLSPNRKRKKLSIRWQCISTTFDISTNMVYNWGWHPKDLALGGLSSMPGASPSGQYMAIAYGDTANTSTSPHGKREHQDGQISPLSNFSKRPRLPSVGPDGTPPRQIGSHADTLRASDISWKNSLMQQQAMTRSIQYEVSSEMFEGLINQNSGATSFSAGQWGMRIGPKEEPFEREKLDSADLGQVKNDMSMMETDTGHLHMHHSRPPQRLPPNLMRSTFAQGSWSNLSQDPRKEEQLQKRKSAESPRLSPGALAQSPLSSKSGELSSGSAGPHFGAGGALGSSQKEKAQAGGTKRRTTSHPKNPVMSNVGSPASVSNISAPLNADSPSMGTPTAADQTMLE
ncbi:hypothetical protein Tsubulata_032674, partial [Turnera subulata]